MPMLNILFGEDQKRIETKPQLEDFDGIGSYLKDMLTYSVQSYANDDKLKALTFVIILGIVVFLLEKRL